MVSDGGGSGSPKSAIEALSDWIKPRKEITGAIAGAIIVASGAVTFVVSHFAAGLRRFE
jgi:hypothetical protein